MTDPTLRTPTLPRMFVPPAKPPLAGLTPSHPPGDRTSKAEKFWRKVVSRRVRNNPERIRRGIAGRRRPPEDMPVVNLSEEEDGPPTAAAPASAPTAEPTIRLIEVYPRHTFRLLRPPTTAGSAVSAAGAAAPKPAEVVAARPTVQPPAPRTNSAPAATTPGPVPAVGDARSGPVSSGKTAPRMLRDPFCLRPTTPREERDVLVDGCLIRVPIG
ncbi:PREDICTED: proteoglycan 4-like, partial [Vollenhovia emeryi]|uniref:proteoglycan 4-like n=1 Tax=Vollenhovia emeryi TaxID=411798 RepID=UPI0005F4325F